MGRGVKTQTGKRITARKRNMGRRKTGKQMRKWQNKKVRWQKVGRKEDKQTIT